MSKTKHNLVIVNSKGIKTEVPLFTSLDDLKERSGHEILVGNETLYFPIGDENAPEATSARIQLSDGTVKAILKNGTPDKTEELITVPVNKVGVSNHTGQFTVPLGVSRLRVSLCPSCMTVKGEIADPDAEHPEMTERFTFYQGTDTTFGNLSAQNNGRNSFAFGCKKSSSFQARENYDSPTNDFYSLFNRSLRTGTPNWVEGGERDSSVRNKFYSGYMNVTPLQKINYSVGGKSGNHKDPQTCGFILIEYGKGIEGN